jgi:hypothetical protein
LSKRFTSHQQLNSQARASLHNLFVSYHESIINGLNEETSALKQVGIGQSPVQNVPSDVAPSDAEGLREALVQNQLLCEELITASSTPPRSAVTIVTDLQLSISHIQTVLAGMQKQSQ